MKMVEVKTAELSEVSLDWLIGKIEGIGIVFYSVNDVDSHPWVMFSDDGVSGYGFYMPSKQWDLVGPLIEKHHCELSHNDDERESRWAWKAQSYCGRYTQFGDTPQIAICRAIVSAKHGDVVSVPAELINGGGL